MSTTNWNLTTCNITNHTSSVLAVNNVFPLASGEYGQYPAAVPPNATASPAFILQSVDSSETGPKGTLGYVLPDGTQLTLEFDQQFQAGTASSFTAILSGGQFMSYGVLLDCSMSPWNGQGARWTVNLTVSVPPWDRSGPPPGAAAQCQYTR